MGTKDRQVVEKSGLKADKVIELLNKAFCDEWLAYYQYWVGAKVAEGLMRPDVQKELEEHANEELGHAGLVAERIISLGGTPVLEPKDWYKFTNCGYDAPKNPDTRVLLGQNIKGEQCAIEVYKAILEYVKGKDWVTGHLARKIMQDEIGHEQDLQDLATDLSYVNKK